MKIVGILLLTLGLLAVAFFMFAQDSRVDSAKAVWRRGTGDVGQLCLDGKRWQLSDPSSTIYQDATVQDGGRVWIRYLAKNAMGSNVQGVFDCPLKKDGTLDEAKMSMEKLDELTKAFANTYRTP